MVHVICADASTTQSCCRVVYCFDICRYYFVHEQIGQLCYLNKIKNRARQQHTKRYACQEIYHLIFSFKLIYIMHSVQSNVNQPVGLLNQVLSVLIILHVGRDHRYCWYTSQTGVDLHDHTKCSLGEPASTVCRFWFSQPNNSLCVA